MLTIEELFVAAKQNEFETVRDYLQELFDDDDKLNALESIVEPNTNNSLLHYACDNGNLDACKFLLMYQDVATAILDNMNSFGHTPLFHAASSGNLSVVQWLVSNGADIDLDYSDHADIVLRNGDQGIFTPLQIACFRGHEDIVTFLVECNAELSGTRRNGKTPLHFASAENHPAIVKLLLKAGADVHACDEEGKSPVDVAHRAVRPLLLSEEYEENGDEEPNESGTGDQDDDDELFVNDVTLMEGLQTVKDSFGAEIARSLTSKKWKIRVAAVTDATMCFENAYRASQLVKMFDGACFMIEIGLQDAVTQVASSCCTLLLKAAFNAVLIDTSFHSKTFFDERPVVSRIVSTLLLRAAGSSEKDSSEAVSSLLFLFCKSDVITRYLTLQLSQLMLSSPLSSSQQSSERSTGSSSNGSWRHQLVAIKMLIAIANQYRMDENRSGLSFTEAMKIGMLALTNSSIHVRTAAIELLVQTYVIQCEESDIKGTPEAIFEHIKNWYESQFKQHNQQLKPSIQAKINNGLKHALGKSKRLLSRMSTEDDWNGSGTGNMSAFDVSLSPRRQAAQRQDELPYAEPLQGSNIDLAVDMLACFGEQATRCLFSNAWAPRVEALSYVQSLVQTRQLSFESHASSQQKVIRAMQTTLTQALQDRVISVFEAGVSLLMDVSIALESSAACMDVNIAQDFIRPLIARLLVKLGDAKNRLHVTTEDALLLLSRQLSSLGPVFLLEELIACDRNVSPQTLSATYLSNKLALVSKLMLEFGVQESSSGGKGLLPLRSVLQLALQVCEHKDQNVRLVSLQIIADTMQVARNAVMPYLDVLARSCRQKVMSKLVEQGVVEADLLMDEVDDFALSTEFARPCTPGIRPPTALGSSTKHRPVPTTPSLSTQSASGAPSSRASPPIQLPYGTALTTEQQSVYSTIIQGFGENLVRCLLDKAWSQREAAIREVERQVVCCAIERVAADTTLPKTLESLKMLAQILDIGLKDTVARVFQCTLRLLQVIATDFLPFVSSEPHCMDGMLRNVVGLVLQKLGDSKQRLRQDCSTLLHSMASLSHVTHARLCTLLVETYQQLVCSSNAIAASPVMIGELLRLFTNLVKEAPAWEQLKLSAILSIVQSALEDKHVDVRNAAIGTFATIYEVTKGDADHSVGLDTFMANLQPSMRATISRSIVPITKTLPLDSLCITTDSSRSARDSGRTQQRQLSVNADKLHQICTEELTELLLASDVSPAHRSLGVNKFIDFLIASTSELKAEDAWETCCLLAKQLASSAEPAVCLAAFDLLELLVNPPSQSNDAECPSYAIPWKKWGVHLVLSSTIRSVVQQSASESVRVRSKVIKVLRLVAYKSVIGKNTVCNAILSFPEQSDTSNGATQTVEEQKISATKLRWQLSLRLELIHEFLVARDDNKGGGGPPHLDAKVSSEPLSLANVVPFLGSCVTHPSPIVKTALVKIMQYLHATVEKELCEFIRSRCSPALQRRLQALVAQATCCDDQESNNAEHSTADQTTCVRGSRASHVRRIAALRPPRSVPAEETQMVVEKFPLPHSAPNTSRQNIDRDGKGNFALGNGGFLMSAIAQSRRQPIWLEQQSDLTQNSNTLLRSINVDEVGPQSCIMVGGGAGIMKAKRKRVL